MCCVSSLGRQSRADVMMMVGGRKRQLLCTSMKGRPLRGWVEKISESERVGRNWDIIREVCLQPSCWSWNKRLCCLRLQKELVCMVSSGVPPEEWKRCDAVIPSRLHTLDRSDRHRRALPLTHGDPLLKHRIWTLTAGNYIITSSSGTF